MSLSQIVPMVLGLSIMLIVFALGLQTRLRDWVGLFSQPALLLRSLLAMSLIMPVVAVLAVKLLGLEQPVSTALIALSLAPVPPLLPGKQTKAGGDSNYAVSLLVVAALFAIVWIPLALELIQLIFGIPLHAHPMDIIAVVGKTVLLPLLAGTIVGLLAKGFAQRLSGLLASIGTLVLLVGLVLVLASAWGAIMALVGDGTLLAMVVVVVSGLVIGHLLGGPDNEDRTVLALACASRHPGMAVALASLEFPDMKGATAAVLLYLLVAALVSLPYVAWRKRVSGLVRSR